MVLASGEYVTANQYQYSDLFWALRGGGGGTYGVVVTVTYRTHEEFPVTSILFQINATTLESALNVTAEYFKLQPSWSDAGWGGYSIFTAGPPGALQGLYLAPNVSEAQVNATLNPFLDNARTATGAQNVASFVTPIPTYYEWYLSFFNKTGQVGTNGELISRLLSREAAEQQPDKVAEVVYNVTASLGTLEFK